MNIPATVVSAIATSTLKKKVEWTALSAFSPSRFVRCATVVWICSTQKCMGVTKMKTKTFSKELYAQYDRMAREATKQFFSSVGKQIIDNPETYRQDLIVKEDEEHKYYVECEVKAVWDKDEFPFPSVQLPYRKRKFFNKRTQFFIWNKSCTRAATFWSNEIKELVPIEVKNKHIASGEYFFQIPLDYITFVEKEA